MHLIHRPNSVRFGLPALLLLALAIPTTIANSQERRTIIRDMSFDGSRPYLGIGMEEVNSENMSAHNLNVERGVIVRSVEKGSPAEAATLKEKDVILEYSGTTVHSTRQLARLVGETPPGRTVELGISREGRRTTLSAKIGEKEGVGLWGMAPGFSEFRRGPGGEYEFDGPGGRMFRFHAPEGRSFGFSSPSPRTGSRERRARLGVTLQEISPQMAEFLGVPGGEGVLITSVSEGSAAAAANLRAGDVVVKAGDRSIERPEDLQEVVARTEPGSKVDFTIVREKKEVRVTVEFPKESSRPSGFSL